MFDVQLYIGRKTPIKRNFYPVKNGWLNIGKPERGGWWTSTFNPTYGSEWVQLSKIIFDYHDQFDSWLIYPESTIRVLTINSFDDLKKLLNEYASPSPIQISTVSNIDFESMSKDWDAIHLTHKGQYETRLTNPSLYGWDVESVLWLNPAFDRVVLLGRKTYSGRDDETDVETTSIERLFEIN